MPIRTRSVGIVVVMMSIWGIMGCATGNVTLIRHKLGAEIPWKVTTNPPGAKMVVEVLNEGLDGGSSFQITTPYVEQNGDGIVKYVVFNNKEHRQIWNITISKLGYKTLRKEIYSTEITANMHFDLVPEKESAVSTASGKGDAEPPANRDIVAVFDIQDKGVGIAPEILKRLSEYLTEAIASTGKYQVIPRSQLKERLVNKKVESFRECYDETCQIEIGQELAAQKSLATSIARLGKKCKITMVLYDLKKSAKSSSMTHI